MPAAPPLQADCEAGAWRNRISFCHRASPGRGFVVVWTAVPERQRHKYTVSPGQAGCCRARNLVRCNRSWKFRRFLSFPNQMAIPAAVNQLWLSERVSSVLQEPVGPGLHQISNYRGSVSSGVWERASDPEWFLLIFLLKTAVPWGSAGQHHPGHSHGQAGTKTPHGNINTHPEGKDTSKGSRRCSRRQLQQGGRPPDTSGCPVPPWQSSGSPQLLPQLCPHEPRAEPGGGKLKFVALALLQCLLVNTTALRSTYFIFMELCPRPEPSAWVRSIQPGLCSIQTHPLPFTPCSWGLLKHSYVCHHPQQRLTPAAPPALLHPEPQPLLCPPPSPIPALASPGACVYLGLICAAFRRSC